MNNGFVFNTIANAPGDRQHDLYINRGSATYSQNPFQSFWMGGFECADHVNAFGCRVDLLKETRHLEMISEDYQSLSVFNIGTVREGIRWSQVEKIPYQYDWSNVELMIKAGQHYSKGGRVAGVEAIGNAGTVRYFAIGPQRSARTDQPCITGR